jgi:hypothetical protein
MVISFLLTILYSWLQKKKREMKIWSLFSLATSRIFPFFLARQPQGVLLHRFSPLKPCANEFSLHFSYTKTLARP